MDDVIYFSAKENTFFFESMKEAYIQTGYWPDDLVLVSEDVYKQFALDKPSPGKVRTAGQDGAPVWADIPVNHIAEAEIQRTALMAEATAKIDYYAAAQEDNDITETELAAFSALKKYRAELRRLDISAAPDITWPVL